MTFARIFLFLSLTGLAGSVWAQTTPLCAEYFKPAPTAYKKFEQILNQNLNRSQLNAKDPLVETAYGTEVPIVHSFEAEGSSFSTIRPWFSDVRPSFKPNLKKAFQAEGKKPTQNRVFRKWLSELKLRTNRMYDDTVDWGAMNLKERLDYLLAVENPLNLLTSRQVEDLMETRAVTFNDIQTNKKAPQGITVGDDLGSWEVRSSSGQVDRADYLRLRDRVEKFLDQKIGHQHLFHAWPKDSMLRKEMAPYYVELMDSMTWFLYWRQVKRSDTDLEDRTVVDHPYLGVYATNSLARLQKHVENDAASRFYDKYRLIGARNFKALEEIPEQKGDIPDWEIRSGNKGVMRDFVEATLESRLVTGDYSGLRAFGQYEFNSQASMHSLTRSLLTRHEVELLERFEETHPLMKWSDSPQAKNNYRTKMIAPLLPWAQRMDIQYKEDLLIEQQTRYAKSLVKIAREFLKVARDPKSTHAQVLQARRKAVIGIKEGLREFAVTTRLDLDFEMYLRPRANFEVPRITVENSPNAILDVNKIDLGIEYSLRVPFNMKFQSAQDANTGIFRLAQTFADKIGAQNPKSLAKDGHGHGIAVKYTVEESKDTVWRFEWDGIVREYQNGKIVNAQGGHIEVVTPKFSPQEIRGPILDLFQESRKLGLAPRRNAGGAHINFDLSPLKKLPPEIGTRRLLNLLSYFESRQELILFMWQHPKRRHAAYPVQRSQKMIKSFNEFEGDWKDLGRMLYETRYFNAFVHRKPKYVPLNLTAVMTPILPKEYYSHILDIKNTNLKWFPNFNKVYGRGEARFFDAPLDENMAALHIKYFRALMNRSFNSEEKILFRPLFKKADVEAWRKDPRKWIQVAEAHLSELGLDPAEFRTLLWDSYRNQLNNEPRQVDYKIFKDFLPSQ